MKKTVWGLLFLAVIAIGILCPVSQAMALSPTKNMTPNELTNWMALLPDNVYLSNLNIPATHDSCTTFMAYEIVSTALGRCQSKPIEEQLNDGIRAFDIRYRCAGGDDLVLCHGDYSVFSDCHDYAPVVSPDTGSEYYAGAVFVKLTLKKVIARVTDFLIKNPTETAILFVTRESGQDAHLDNERAALNAAYSVAEEALGKVNHKVIYVPDPSKTPSKWFLANELLSDELIENTDYEKEIQNSFYGLTMHDVRGNLIIVETHINSLVGSYNGVSLDQDKVTTSEKWKIIKPYLDGAKPITLTERRDSDFLKHATKSGVVVETHGCLGFTNDTKDKDRRALISKFRSLSGEAEERFYIEHPEYTTWNCWLPGHEKMKHPAQTYEIKAGAAANAVTGVFTSCWKGGAISNATVMTSYLNEYDFKPNHYYGFVIMDSPAHSVIRKIVETNLAVGNTEYISYVRGYKGKTLSEAMNLCTSDGYTLLRTNGICNVNPYGDPIVIGYKTSKNPLDAIRQFIGYYGYGKEAPNGYSEVAVKNSDFNYFTRFAGKDAEYTYLAYRKFGSDKPITQMELVSSGGSVKVNGSDEIFNFNKGLNSCIQLLTGTGMHGMHAFPEEGDYIIYPVIDPTKCLEIAGGADATEEHRILQIGDAGRSTGKVFHLEKVKTPIPFMADASYKISAVHSRLPLEAVMSLNPGADIWQAKNNDDKNQRWAFEYAGNGNVYIRSLGSINLGGVMEMESRYMDVADGKTDSGTHVISWRFTGNTNQMFRLAKVADIPEGDYYIYTALDPSKRLDIAGGAGAKENGANLHIWSDHESTGSVFTIEKDANDDYYTIKARHSQKVLSIEDNVAISGKNILQWENLNNLGQRWTFEDAGDGYVYIHSPFGLFMDVFASGKQDGTNVIAFRYLDSNGQRFKLVRLCGDGHEYKATYPEQQPTLDMKTGKITYGWKEYYECTNGHFFAKYENGELSGQIKDIEAWKNGEGRLGEVVKITFEDKNKTTVVYNLKGQKLPDYVFPMPVFDETSVFLEWQSPDQKHFDCTVETLSDMAITANRMAISDIYDQYNQKNYSALTTASINRNTKRELSGKIYKVTQTPLETYKYLTVKDWAVIIIPDGYAVTLRNGIHVASGATLIIMSPEESMGTGSFKAYGTTSDAGIGGTKNESGGNVAVYNCNVVAKGGARAAAIGGGERGNGGAFYICGGTVRADGGIDGGTSTIGGTMNGGAGIGGGMYGGGAKVQLDGGEVYAYGAANAAGLGKGSFCEGDRWEEIHLGKSMRVWDITNGNPGVVLQQVTPEILNSIKSVHIAGLGDDDGKYTIIKGANQAICKDAVSAMFASDADFLLFDHVEVDGKAVPREYYAAMPGSTVITFNSSLISSLSLGEHNLRIVSKDGFAATDFTVIAPLPKTGDSTNLSLLVTLLIASTGMILLMSVKAKKKRS